MLVTVDDKLTLALGSKLEGSIPRTSPHFFHWSHSVRVITIEHGHASERTRFGQLKEIIYIQELLLEFKIIIVVSIYK